MISGFLMGREKRDLLQGLDLHILDQVAPLGDRGPILILSLASKNSVALAFSLNPGYHLRSACQLPNSSWKPLWPPIPGLQGPGASGTYHSTHVIPHLVFSQKQSQCSYFQLIIKILD